MRYRFLETLSKPTYTRWGPMIASSSSQKLGLILSCVGEELGECVFVHENIPDLKKIEKYTEDIYKSTYIDAHTNNRPV